MRDISSIVAEINDRIAAARENLGELVEQAAAYSGAADESLMSQRIDKQAALLERLTKQRDDLLKARCRKKARINDMSGS